MRSRMFRRKRDVCDGLYRWLNEHHIFNGLKACYGEDYAREVLGRDSAR